MKRNFEIGELERAILHHGLCLLGGEARKQNDQRLLERVESLRLLLYPELESQPSVFASATPDRQSENQRTLEDIRGQETVKPPQQQTPYKPTLPPLNTYQPQPPPSTPPPATSNSSSGRGRISDKQSGRFYAIGKKSGKRPSEITAFLASLGFKNYKEITVDRYDECINWLQA